VLPCDPYEQDMTLSFARQAQHLFGCDQQGRDLFSRILVGTQISLTVGLLAVSISLVVGVTLGAIAL
jgi:peptide/nickel transport system permease protein